MILKSSCAILKFYETRKRYISSMSIWYIIRQIVRVDYNAYKGLRELQICCAPAVLNRDLHLYNKNRIHNSLDYQLTAWTDHTRGTSQSTAEISSQVLLNNVLRLVTNSITAVARRKIKHGGLGLANKFREKRSGCKLKIRFGFIK